MWAQTTARFSASSKVTLPFRPYPAWAQNDGALASLAVLMRPFHDVSAQVGLVDLDWSAEMADPNGGVVVCHNDICLENVVFRDRQAVGLLDFDFAAPGDPVRDLAAMARMCVPVDDPVSHGESRLVTGGPSSSDTFRYTTLTDWMLPSGGRSWATWTAPLLTEASGYCAKSRRATQTSSRCGMTSEAWSGSIAAAGGGKPTGEPSQRHSGDPESAAPCRLGVACSRDNQLFERAFGVLADWVIWVPLG